MPGYNYRKKPRKKVARFLSQKSKKTKSIKKSNRSLISIDHNIAKEIWGIIHLGIGVITILSIQQNFGIIGEIWMSILNPIIGWGIYIIPALFIGSSIVLFVSKKFFFGLERIFGLIFMLASILGMLHLYVPENELYEIASQGQYGGYVGAVSNFILRNLLGISTIGTITVFLITFFVAMLLSFEISLGSLIKLFKPEIKIERKTVEKKPELKVNLGGQDEEEVVSLVKEEKIDDSNEQKIEIKRSIPIQQNDPEKGIVKNISGQSEKYQNWEFPSLDLLDEGKAAIQINDKILQKNAELIRSKLSQFGITVTMHEVHVGPTVIQYTLKPEEGVKLSKIVALKDDLTMALAADSVRIEAPIPGQSLVGIEVPNEKRCTVHLREIMESKSFQQINSRLRLPLGRDVSGKAMAVDLASMPHLLIAGATGSGKSVGTNTFLLSLLYQNSPEHLKLIMIDPKRVELSSYNNIPHLLTPVITDPEKASMALKWAVAEMNRRYQLCAEAKHRNIIDYNADKKVTEKMPNIVIIIDELADLMMTAGKDVENSICRIAQMARAVGMHLIIATQRPSVNVLTGLIKANIPARIAYAVSSSIDSRTIIDGGGAEDLLGKGDMLYLGNGTGKLTRVQGIYVSPSEIEKVTNRIKIIAAPDYDDSILTGGKVPLPGMEDLGNAEEDDLYLEALELIRKHRKASASLLQRRLKVGYARAARLLDLLEEDGKIGPVNGAKPREIFVE